MCTLPAAAAKGVSIMADKNHYRDLRTQYEEMFGKAMEVDAEYSREQMIALHEQCIARHKTYQQLKRSIALKSIFGGKKLDQWLEEWVKEDLT